MKTKPVVQLKQLTKKINGKVIIDTLNLDLYPGEVFGFLGPNGAGKTTTIRMMVGLMKPTDGSVVINGYNLQSDFQNAIKHVGAIVENPELYKYLTGYQNLIHFARMAGGITKERIIEIVDQVGLSHAIHDKVKTYSLGMRQRLGLAQALLHNPKFLILDEPTNGLDPAGIREFRKHLRKIAAEQQVSIIVSSHLLSEIELMCDRIGIIKQGRLIDIRDVHTEIDIEKSYHQYLFRVEQREEARIALPKTFQEKLIEKEEEGIILGLKKDEVPLCAEILVKEGVRIYGIEKIKETLEDQFLAITGGSQ